MKVMPRCMLVLTSACALADGAQSGVTPVQKVLGLLGGMVEKGKTEKHEEQVQFAAYKQFCEDTTTEKKRAIAEANERIEELKANIGKYAADAARLKREIGQHDADIATWKGDETAATKVRNIERGDYDKLHQDYSESVDALQRAIQVLRSWGSDRRQGSLMQISALKDLRLMPKEATRAIEAFLQDGEEPAEGLAVSAPEAYAYEFQSHGIIEMLEKLLDKFHGERADLEKKEMNAKRAYELLSQDLKAQIDEATQDRTEKSETKAKKLQAKADAEGDLRDTTTTRDADQKYLDDLTATCETKASDFESRQQLRAEEIEAIMKAIEIISSAAVSGNADKHLPSLMQLNGSLMAQLRADTHSGSQARVAQYLRERSKQLNSRVLSAVALHVSGDPFRKVKKMIKDLLVRLMEEANEEAEHKGWCDTELATNEQTRKQKTNAVESLHAETDELEASIAKLKEDIADLTTAVAELDAAMAKATQLRQQEKTTNLATIKDAQEAQTAVAQALLVLREFYAKAAEATALLQQQPVAPEIFDSPYRGMQAEHGGVVGMLEVIESDFARLEADTTSAEATAQKVHDEFMEESRVDKVQKQTDIEHKEAKRQDQEQALGVKRNELELTQKELDAALAYFDKLKPSCVDAGVAYDDRVARRKEEIQSLQDALRILNGEDLA